MEEYKKRERRLYLALAAMVCASLCQSVIALLYFAVRYNWFGG